MKITPAPYKVLPDLDGFPGALCVAHAGTGQLVASRIGKPADAALLSVSPELLNICLRVIGMAQTSDRMYDSEFQELAKSARKVYKLAKQRTGE